MNLSDANRWMGIYDDLGFVSFICDCKSIVEEIGNLFISIQTMQRLHQLGEAIYLENYIEYVKLCRNIATYALT